MSPLAWIAVLVICILLRRVWTSLESIRTQDRYPSAQVDFRAWAEHVANCERIERIAADTARRRP